MQTSLDPQLERVLLDEAAQRGISVEENAREVLERHAKVLLHGALPADIDRDMRTPEDAFEWILSRNPDLRRVDSGKTDWRRLAHEGHRY